MTAEELYDLSDKVQEMIDKEGGRADVYPWNVNYDMPVVIVSISWGDWKHDHGFVKYLCKKHGGVVISSTVTEEDGSDCYSADHIVAFVEGFKEVADEEVE